ncbi:MAG TPA: NAD-dependent epimerase/dehydratase family protein [Nocardioidaceae bacterium]|nr:NAD-dependent epimerase/dehydratase family protein [Nocardioidaceae bacterium]
MVEADVLDPEALAEAALGCSHVIHLAAQCGVPASIADPVRDAEVNVHGTLNALLAARDASAEGFVFASSNAPLGEITPPAHEGIVPRPTSPYGASKLAGEAYCSAFAASYGLPTVALRFSNVYGPYSYHKGSVVAAFCKQALAGEPLIIYGDGTQTRDFVFVDDLCRGIAAAVVEGGESIVAHLGSGVETTVLDVARKVADRFEAVSFEHRPARVGDVPRSSADISTARELFGFAPSTSLDDGLDRTVAWFRESDA